MSSKVDMINMALVSLRAETVALPVSSTEIGRKIIAMYDPLLRSYLRSHIWSFAKKETSLARVDVTPALDDYDYVFTLPPDFIRLIKTSVEPDYSHKIKGRRIYSNSTTLSIEYIYFNEDPNSYDDAFVEAFAAKLAAELAYSITGDKEVTKFKWQEFGLKNNAARSLNGQEQTLDEPQSDTYMNSRHAVTSIVSDSGT